jgi:hypothetical protein
MNDYKYEVAVEGQLTGKLDYSKKSLFHIHFVHHKSHTEWPEIEPGSPWS